MTCVREKFTTRIDRALLAEIRRLAKQESRQLCAIIEDALRAHVEKCSKAKPRPHFMIAYRSSLQRYGDLYEKLAN